VSSDRKVIQYHQELMTDWRIVVNRFLSTKPKLTFTVLQLNTAESVIFFDT